MNKRQKKKALKKEIGKLGLNQGIIIGKNHLYNNYKKGEKVEIIGYEGSTYHCFNLNTGLEQYVHHKDIKVGKIEPSKEREIMGMWFDDE